MTKLHYVIFTLFLIGCTTQKSVQPICIYIEPEYETEVVDFGGLADEQCLHQTDTITISKTH